MNADEIEAVLEDRRRLPEVEVREGWRIVDFRGEAEGPPARAQGLPLSELRSVPPARSVQLDFFAVPAADSPRDAGTGHGRAILVDSTLGDTGGEPAFSIAGRSEGAGGRVWILQVRQPEIPIRVDDERILPFQSFVRLREGSRIRVGVTEFTLRGDELQTDGRVDLRLEIPAPSGPEGLPLAAAPRRSDEPEE